MAHHKSAIKRIRTNETSRQYNMHYKSMMKSEIKKILGMQDKEVAAQELNGAYSLLDKLAQKGIIHKNKAANQKARLTRHVASL